MDSSSRAAYDACRCNCPDCKQRGSHRHHAKHVRASRPTRIGSIVRLVLTPDLETTREFKWAESLAGRIQRAEDIANETGGCQHTPDSDDFQCHACWRRMATLIIHHALSRWEEKPLRPHMCGDCEAQGRTGTGAHGETAGAEHCSCWYEGRAEGRSVAFRESKEDCRASHTVEVQRSNALQAERNGIISRLRAKWPHIEMARFQQPPIDPGPPTCLRCAIEDEIGEPWHDGLGPPRGGCR